MARGAYGEGSRLGQGTHPLYLLIVPQRGQRIRKPRPVGQRQLRVQLEQRHQHEPPARHLADAGASAARAPARCRRAAVGRRRAGAGRGEGRRTSGRARPRSPCRRRAGPAARAPSRSERPRSGSRAGRGSRRPAPSRRAEETASTSTPCSPSSVDRRLAGAPRDRRRSTRARGSRRGRRRSLILADLVVLLELVRPLVHAPPPRPPRCASGSGGSGFAARTRHRPRSRTAPPGARR